jgi:hypothetical protein
MSKVVRIPVVLGRGKNGVPLMPTKISKAKKLVELGKAKWVFSRSLRLRHLRLLVQPSGFEFQSINLGFDPGSHFDGLTISSKYFNHLNVELIHNKTVKDRMSSRRSNRRVRRSRLRSRPARFDSRNSEKMVPTIRSMLEFRKFTVKETLKIFPISKVIFERVAYSGPKQKSFTQVHLGQTTFLNWLKTKISKVITVKGYITKAKRIKLFGKDLKTKDKGERSFFAHCLDSFSISRMGLPNLTYLPKIAIVRFITKNWLNRRELFKVRKLTKDKKYYFRYGKGGIKNLFTKMSKPNVCYTLKYLNSFKEFNLNINPKVECLKHSQPQNYGGTIAKGQSRSEVPRGMSKRCILKSGKIVGYLNRYVSFN